MNEKDLRVVKTKENIFETFLSLLAAKPIRKITVQELCTKARINKGTFYYHYDDIYDLYGECVRKEIGNLFDFIDCYDTVTTDPVRFLRKLMEHRIQYSSSVDVIMQDKTIQYYKDILIDGFIEKTYKTTGRRKTDDTDARLYTLFNTIMELSPRFEKKQEVADTVLMDLAKGLFPNG